MANVLDQAIDTLDFETTKVVISREKIINYFAKFTQFLTWPFLYVVFNIFFKISIRGQDVFERTENPFIIIANHTSFYDSFLFRLILGLFTNHLPLRFMAVNSFESSTMNLLAKIGLVDFVYSLFGVFTVTPGLGIDRNLKKAKHIISLGGNIVIYPEGRIIRDGIIGPFKNGSAVLYKETNVDVIPVSIKKMKNGYFRPQIFINVGNRIEISKTRSVEEITKQFRNTIVMLNK